MQTGKIYLGSKNANEQLVLGNTAVAQLEEIVDILKTLLNACKLAANSGGPVASLKGVADTLTTRLNSINLKAMLSNSNYTV
jgi:hypothetical protein